MAKKARKARTADDDTRTPKARRGSKKAAKPAAAQQAQGNPKPKLDEWWKAGAP